MHTADTDLANTVTPTEHPQSPYDHFDGYTGPATLTICEHSLSVTVDLRGFFHPGNGFYQWYGRIGANKKLTDVLGRRRTEAAHVATPHGEADATLSDPDPWGRFRIIGTSRPPFVTTFDIDDE